MRIVYEFPCALCCVIWVKNAPKFGHDSDEELCNFIEKYVCVAIPENECKLKELVLLLQQHKHSLYCKRRKSYYI